MGDVGSTLGNKYMDAISGERFYVHFGIYYQEADDPYGSFRPGVLDACRRNVFQKAKPAIAPKGKMPSAAPGRIRALEPKTTCFCFSKRR